jgi:hypothetical protein
MRLLVTNFFKFNIKDLNSIKPKIEDEICIENDMVGFYNKLSDL